MIDVNADGGLAGDVSSMLKRRPFRFVLLQTALIAVVPAAAEDYGRALVEANCARCHAIGLDDESIHPEAPAFRDLHLRYPVDALEEAFGEGIWTGHPDMPEFIATPDQIAAIIGYIEGLSP